MDDFRPSSLIALTHRNFRLLWIGQLVSMAGSMMQSAAILWQVSLLVPPSHRGLALGMVGAVRLVPIVVFSMVSGVVADALDRRRLMLITQTGMAAGAALLAWVDFAGVRTLWPIYGLAALTSAFWAFDGPARWCRASTCRTRSASTPSCSRPPRSSVRRWAAW